VGITRARRHLPITCCLFRKKYGKLEERAPTRFLAEIPPELLNQEKDQTGETSAEEVDRLARNVFARMRNLFGS